MAGQVVCGDQKKISTVKAMLTARDMLLDELQKLSKAIDQKIDLTELISDQGDGRFSSVLQGNLRIASDNVSEVRMRLIKLIGKAQMV